MAIETVKFSNTRLTGSSKKGILVKDENGYRTMVLGGLDIHNTAGEFYTAKGAKDLFENSSSFMRRVQRGALRSEVAHPQYLKGMTSDEYIARMMRIEESNVCAHIKEVWLDFNAIKESNSKPVIAIMGKVKPSGPKAGFLEQSMDNPSENVCFSVRGLTKDTFVRGINVRELRDIITFDYVNEPGIPIAEKYMSPAMESLDEHTVSKDEFLDAMHRKTVSGVATEESVAIARSICASLGWLLPSGAVPVYNKW